MGWRGGNGNETLHLWAREERSEERLHLHTASQSGNRQSELKNIIKQKNKKGTKDGMRWKNIRFCVSYVESTVSGQFVCMRVCTCVILFV